MPLQNRVTPFGELERLAGRGLFTGNRGVLHDGDRTIVRRWTSRRWILCTLEYKGIRRRVMTPHRWTELFFLDEAAGFAAGHRPCAECRRPAYRDFRARWAAVHGEPVSADIMDARIHADRLNGRMKRTYRARLEDLPDGTFVALDGRAWLLLESQLLAWSDGGYCERKPLERAPPEVDVLTPASIVAILAHGYIPFLHPSAGR